MMLGEAPEDSQTCDVILTKNTDASDDTSSYYA